MALSDCGEGVALPRRGVSGDYAQDTRERFPRRLGGQNGSIELPSRVATLEGRGSPAGLGRRAPTDGAYGPIVLVFRGLLDWSRGAGPFPWPLGAGVTHYHRRDHPNLGPVASFEAPRAGTVAWTTNRTAEADVPADPIPWSAHHVSQTWRQIFDNRLQAIYWPRDRLQMGRELLEGGPQMLEPYFPRLTRWTQPGSYGQTTQEL